MSFREYGLFQGPSGNWESMPVPNMEEGFMQLDIGIGEGAWEGFDGTIDLHATLEKVALLPVGTRAGNPSVELLLKLTDGRWVHASVTLALWHAATMAFRGAMGGPDGE